MAALGVGLGLSPCKMLLSIHCETTSRESCSELFGNAQIVIVSGQPTSVNNVCKLFQLLGQFEPQIKLPRLSRYYTLIVKIFQDQSQLCNNRGSHTSWNILESPLFIFLQISGIRKVLEKFPTRALLLDPLGTNVPRPLPLL